MFSPQTGKNCNKYGSLTQFAKVCKSGRKRAPVQQVHEIVASSDEVYFSDALNVGVLSGKEL